MVVPSSDVVISVVVVGCVVASSVVVSVIVVVSSSVVVITTLAVWSVRSLGVSEYITLEVTKNGHIHSLRYTVTS